MILEYALLAELSILLGTAFSPYFLVLNDEKSKNAIAVQLITCYYIVKRKNDLLIMIEAVITAITASPHTTNRSMYSCYYYVHRSVGYSTIQRAPTILSKYVAAVSATTYNLIMGIEHHSRQGVRSEGERRV